MSDLRAGRRGLLVAALLLTVLAAGVDLLRGRDSLIRSWWSGLAVTRGESTRTRIEDFRDRGFGR